MNSIKELLKVQTIIPLIAVSIGFVYALSDKIFSLNIIEDEKTISFIIWTTIIFFSFGLLLAFFSGNKKAKTEIDIEGRKNKVMSYKDDTTNRKTKIKGNENTVTQSKSDK